MLETVFGIFIILHGLVHLLYFGQSWRVFEMADGMSWPDGSWVFARWLDRDVNRLLACSACGLAAAGLVVGGLGLLAGLAWWSPVVISAAAFSAVLYLLFWDGKLNRLDNQGAIGLLINAAVVVGALTIS